MARFYGEFLGPGDVGFDIGAHVGSRVRAWRRLGARVIAVEPQPDLLRILRLLFGRDRGVTIVPTAAGARAGRARLGVSTATPTVSSMSPDWIESVAADRGFARVRWDRSIEVEVATLDELIAAHGEPAFCKIDVEGFEVDVLEGLTRPLRGLSFEYLPAAHDASLQALDHLERLGAAAGGYRYNYSPSRRCSSSATAGSTRPTWCNCSNACARWAAPATSTPAWTDRPPDSRHRHRPEPVALNECQEPSLVNGSRPGNVLRRCTETR